MPEKNISNIPEAWSNDDLPKPNTNKYRKRKSFTFLMFLISFFILLLSGIFTFFSFSKHYASFTEKNIEIYTSLPASVASGEETTLDVSVINNNPIPMIDAYVIASYDSGENISGDKNIVSKRIDFGQIMQNMTINKNTPIVLFGDEGTERNIKATLFYKTDGSKAEFNKEAEILPITLKTSPVSISINSLKEVRKNTNTDITITIKNNTENEMGNLIVSARAPKDFSYSTSSLPLFNRSPSWLIKSLPAGGKQEVVLTGKLTGDINQEHNFTFFVGVSNKNIINQNTGETSPNLSLDNIYAKTEKSITVIGQYFEILLDSGLSSNNSTAAPGELLDIDFTYKNNLKYPLNNVIIFGEFLGGVVDSKNTKIISGNYNTAENSFFWDKNYLPALASVASNASGKLRIQVRIDKDAKPGSVLNMKIYSKGDRSSEAQTDEDQDISLEKDWVISE